MAWEISEHSPEANLRNSIDVIKPGVRTFVTDLISNNTSSFQDSLASLLGDTEGTEGHLWNLEDSDVIGDGANNHGDLLSVAGLLHVPDQPGDGERGAVDLAHKESLENDPVELGLGPPGQEPVQLHQQPQVDVLALGLSPPDFTVLVVADINTHDVFWNLNRAIINMSQVRI